MRTRTKNLISNLRAKGKVSIARAEARKQMQEQELQVGIIRVPGRRPMKAYVVPPTTVDNTHVVISATTGEGKTGINNVGRN